MAQTTPTNPARVQLDEILAQISTDLGEKLDAAFAVPEAVPALLDEQAETKIRTLAEIAIDELCERVFEVLTEAIGRRAITVIVEPGEPVTLADVAAAGVIDPADAAAAIRRTRDVVVGALFERFAFMGPVGTANLAYLVNPDDPELLGLDEKGDSIVIPAKRRK